MQTISDLSLISNKNCDTDTELSRDFMKLHMNSEVEESQLRTDENEECEDEDEEFSFAINGGGSSPISADDAFEDGQIRPIYPLFNRDLMLGHGDLPVRPPVEKLFIETPARKSEESDGIVTGPYCARSKTPEMSKKSNSTGFSKLWRFKEYMQRSNSDGRDAYVFFNHSETKTEAKFSHSKTAGEASSEKKTTAGGKKMKKSQKTMSPHETYLKKKGYKTEEERRRSYLPYRPELVGFFTNVNGGGLSKNVHPY